MPCNCWYDPRDTYICQTCAKPLLSHGEVDEHTDLGHAIEYHEYVERDMPEHTAPGYWGVDDDI